MMKSLFRIMLVVFPGLCFSQSWVGTSAGASFSSVSFQNSQFEQYTNLKGSPGALFTCFFQTHIPDGVPRRPFDLGDMITLEAGLKGAHFRDHAADRLTTWSFYYMTVGIGGRHYHVSHKFLKWFIGGALTADFLAGGSREQLYQRERITTLIRRNNISATGETGIYFNLTDDTLCTFGLDYSRGLHSIEKSRNHKTWLHAWSASFGFVVSARKLFSEKK